jgi:hypothetical protein
MRICKRRLGGGGEATALVGVMIGTDKMHLSLEGQGRVPIQLTWF